MNTSNGVENEKMLLKLLDEAFGGWPVVKSYLWNEKDFHWTKSIIRARHLGLNYKSLLVVSVFARRMFEDNLMLWVGISSCF